MTNASNHLERQHSKQNTALMKRSPPDSIKRPLQSSCILKETGDEVLISYCSSISSVP